MSTISSIDVRLFRIPLSEVLHDAKHGAHFHFELITATVHLENGLSGTGYTYTGGRGGSAIAAMIKDDLVPFPVGKDSANVEQLYDDMQWHIHYVGRGGIASFAISACDIALWDLRCRREDVSLWRYLGGETPTTRAYAGGIDLNFSLDKLQRQTEGYLDRGFAHIKIKVGLPRAIPFLQS